MKYILFFLVLLTTTSLSAQSSGVPKLSDALSMGKIYGSHCGIIGKHPPTRILVEQLLADKDDKTLSSWLDSPNLVIQTYAAEALIRWHNAGHFVDPDDKNHVLRIKNKEDEISSCQGCIHEVLTIKECLKDFEFGNPR